MLLSFRTGDSPGKHHLTLTVEQPDGKRSTVLDQDIEFSQPEHGGANVKAVCQLHVFSSAVFWLDVFLDRKRITRMPFKVEFVREGQTSA